MSGKTKIIAATAAIALVLLGAALVLAVRTTPADTAGNFLEMLGRGEVEEAYAIISPDLRARQNLDVFERSVEALNLANFASVSWKKTDRRQEGVLKLSGQVQTRAGEKFPLEMTLTQGADGVWLVDNFGPPAVEPTAPPAP